MVKLGALSQKKVSEQTQLSYRQVKRLYKRYQFEGDAGLIHKARGRVSNRKHPHYDNFGPTCHSKMKMSDLVLDSDSKQLSRVLKALIQERAVAKLGRDSCQIILLLIRHE